MQIRFFNEKTGNHSKKPCLKLNYGLLTYEDYVRLPQDGKIHEIIRGKHYNHPAPTIKHQRISINIARIMSNYVLEKKLGFWFHAPCDVILDKYNVVQPDHVFILKENERIITEKNIKGVPDLIVEITSPIGSFHSRKLPPDPDYDKKTNFKLYERFKVPHYWIFGFGEELFNFNDFSFDGFKLNSKLPDSKSKEDRIYEYVLDKKKGKYKLRKVWEKGEVFNPALFPNLKVKVNDFFCVINVLFLAFSHSLLSSKI